MLRISGKVHGFTKTLRNGHVNLKKRLWLIGNALEVWKLRYQYFSIRYFEHSVKFGFNFKLIM